MPRNARNVAASVRQRLLNLSKERGQDFNVVLTQYALERLLYRISKSDYANRFVLKGAMLFVVWSGHSLRPTCDLDLLGYGEYTEEHLKEVFAELCSMPVEPDGLVYSKESIGVATIRVAQEYGGQRVTLDATLENARIPIQVDVGFGDVITPKAETVDYPSLLDLPRPRIQIYPRETVVAEKLHAMVVLGFANSRMKDFYDIYLLAKRFDFDGVILTAAIKATFELRKTPLPPGIPICLTDEFAMDASKIIQWRSFVRRMRSDNIPIELAQIVGFLKEYLSAPLAAAFSSVAWNDRWSSGGPWTNEEEL